MSVKSDKVADDWEAIDDTEVSTQYTIQMAPNIDGMQAFHPIAPILTFTSVFWVETSLHACSRFAHKKK